MSRLIFDTDAHKYYLDSVKHQLPSVTTILGQLINKPALVPWAAREAADYAVAYWDELSAKPPDERRQLIKTAHDRAKTKAAASGLDLHDWAMHLLQGKSVTIPERYRGSVNGLAEFWERSQWRPWLFETMVWSESDDDYGATEYAGTLDLIARQETLGLGYILLDYKTGSGVYWDMALQLAAYASAQHIVIGDEDKDMVPISRCGILHVRPDGTTLHTLTDSEYLRARDAWELYRTLHALGPPRFSLREPKP